METKILSALAVTFPERRRNPCGSLRRVALALLSLYKVSVSSRVADVEDFRTDMKRFVQSVARHCTAENLLQRAFLIRMATRRELNLLFNANVDALMQKGVGTHQKRWVSAEVPYNNGLLGLLGRRNSRGICS